MCVVSMISDHYLEKWRHPDYVPPNTFGTITVSEWPPPQLPGREQVQELIELLKKAKIYDEKNNEPNCELEAKRAALKAVADALGLGEELP